MTEAEHVTALSKEVLLKTEQITVWTTVPIIKHLFKAYEAEKKGNTIFGPFSHSS